MYYPFIIHQCQECVYIEEKRCENFLLYLLPYLKHFGIFKSCIFKRLNVKISFVILLLRVLLKFYTRLKRLKLQQN